MHTIVFFLCFSPYDFNLHTFHLLKSVVPSFGSTSPAFTLLQSASALQSPPTPASAAGVAAAGVGRATPLHLY